MLTLSRVCALTAATHACLPCPWHCEIRKTTGVVPEQPADEVLADRLLRTRSMNMSWSYNICSSHCQASSRMRITGSPTSSKARCVSQLTCVIRRPTENRHSSFLGARDLVRAGHAC